MIDTFVVSLREGDFIIQCLSAEVLVWIRVGNPGHFDLAGEGRQFLNSSSFVESRGDSLDQDGRLLNLGIVSVTPMLRITVSKYDS